MSKLAPQVLLPVSAAYLCRSALARELACVSGEDAVAGSQSSRASALYGSWVWPEGSGIPADPCGSELAHEESGASAGDASAVIQSSRASALLRELGVAGEFGNTRRSLWE